MKSRRFSGIGLVKILYTWWAAYGSDRFRKSPKSTISLHPNGQPSNHVYPEWPTLVSYMAMVQNLFNPVELGNSSTLRQRDNIFRSLWHIEKWKIIGQWLRIFFYFLLIRIRIQLLYSMQILIRIQLYLRPVGSSFKSLVKNTLWRVFCSLKKHTKILLKSIKKLSWPKFKKIPIITII